MNNLIYRNSGEPAMALNARPYKFIGEQWVLGHAGRRHLSTSMSTSVKSQGRVYIRVRSGSEDRIFDSCTLSEPPEGRRIGRLEGSAVTTALMAGVTISKLGKNVHKMIETND